MVCSYSESVCFVRSNSGRRLLYLCSQSICCSPVCACPSSGALVSTVSVAGVVVSSLIGGDLLCSTGPPGGVSVGWVAPGDRKQGSVSGDSLVRRLGR